MAHWVLRAIPFMSSCCCLCTSWFCRISFYNLLMSPNETCCVCVWKASRISYLIPRPRARTTASWFHRSWVQMDARSLCFWMGSPLRRWHEPSCHMQCLLGSMENSSLLEARAIRPEKDEWSASPPTMFHIHCLGRKTM